MKVSPLNNGFFELKGRNGQTYTKKGLNILKNTFIGRYHKKYIVVIDNSEYTEYVCECNTLAEAKKMQLSIERDLT